MLGLKESKYWSMDHFARWLDSIHPATIGGGWGCLVARAVRGQSARTVITRHRFGHWAHGCYAQSIFSGIHGIGSHAEPWKYRFD